MDENKLEKVLKLLEAANADYATTKDVRAVFEAIIGAVNDLKGTLGNSVDTSKADNAAKIGAISAQLSQLETSLRSALVDRSTYDTTTARLQNDIQAVKDAIPTIPEIPVMPDLTPLENGLAALMAWEPKPERTAAQIRDELETLEGEDRLDASAIKNLPEAVNHIRESTVPNQALWSLMDVDVSGITTGQSIKWDGVRWIPFTPSGANTSVFGEAPTDSGDQTNFTLANTPVAGTLRLYRGGAYQQATVDYTLSGGTITLTAVLQSGEVLLADYEY